jgi:GTP-binding protein Era
VDPLTPTEARAREALLDLVARSPAPLIGVVNKVDATDEGAVLSVEGWLEEATRRRAGGGEVVQISALRRSGLESLLSAIERRLPPGPFLYPEDEIASDPIRLFAAEFVREAIFENFHSEIPYATYCEVEAFRDDPGRTYVQVVIYVERASQKGILIGKGGKAIRSLGTKARGRIELLLDRPVYLDLWIKVLPGWRKKKNHLRRLGFTVPDDDADPRAS